MIKIEIENQIKPVQSKLKQIELKFKNQFA